MIEGILSGCSALLKTIRAQKPLVHHITNYVSANDCANVTLAVGASPIMADCSLEVAAVTAASDSLLLNLGTPNQQRLESMLISGKTANERGIPVVFDPVGVGISAFRRHAAEKLMRQVKIDVLRGNATEICVISGDSPPTCGIDSPEMTDSAKKTKASAQQIADAFGCVVAVTGAIDIVSDGTRTVEIENGHPTLSQITGTGCMTSSLAACFSAASVKTRHDCYTAAVGAIICMGIAGEIAHTATDTAGSGSYRIALIDSIGKMDGKTLCIRGKLRDA